MKPPLIVIGSGPSGVAAASALLSRRLSVVMLDAGLTLEEKHQKNVRALGAAAPKDWDAEIVEAIRGSNAVGPRGVDVKRLFGSDFPYRSMDGGRRTVLRGAKMIHSLACGGLSNVWGASIFPFATSDMEDWPVTEAELAPHYRAVLSLMPHAGFHDDLAADFPLYSDNFQEYRISRQIEAFLANLDERKDMLSRAGFRWGRSRLAVQFASQGSTNGCCYCGFCLYGCPYGLIYSSGATVDQLRRNDNFSYLPGLFVDRLEEDFSGVRVVARPLHGGGETDFRASRVLLAMGPVASTGTILRSLRAFNRPVTLAHSEHFQIPLARYDGITTIANEPLHTLTQATVMLRDGAISPYTVNMQVYGYNDLYKSALRRMLGPLFPVLSPVIPHFLGRLLVVKGYLHSRDSSCVEAVLEPGPTGTLVLTGATNGSASAIVKRVVEKLWSNRSGFRAIPIPRATHIGLPGTGNHSGASFPMRTHPTGFEADVWGRPAGLKRIHVVDSSVLPTIPATTITLPVMANAHRIATAVAEGL